MALSPVDRFEKRPVSAPVDEFCANHWPACTGGKSLAKALAKALARDLWTDQDAIEYLQLVGV